MHIEPRDGAWVAEVTGLGFSLRPSPMRALAAEARPEPARPYVLIIDEINRANLTEVFGELYFHPTSRGPEAGCPV